MKTLLKLTITTLTLITLTACSSSGGGKDSEHGLIEEAPVAKSQTLQTKSGSSISITLQATDANDDSLTYRITTPPKHGKLTGTPPQVTYTPDAGHIGDDSFGFVANDGQADSVEVTVTLHIVSGDDNGSDGSDGSDGSNGGGDDNTTTGGDNNGTTGGDNSGTTGGNDNNTTGGSDDNGTTRDNDDNGTAGGNDDNTTGGGTDTSTTTLQTLTLSIADTTLNKDHNTTLTTEAKYSDGTTKPVTENIEWIATPSDAVAIQGNTLTALKDVNVTLQARYRNKLSNKVNLNIYWEVNGHRLPPEPDPAVNNATLLGVDVNHNDVRDDVERWIYKTYKDKHPIHIDIAMQAARGYKLVLEHPERAKEIYPVLDAATWCEGYYQIYAKYFNGSLLVKEDIDTKFFRKKIYFNTKKRMDAYIQYDHLLSGGIYSTPSIDKNMTSYCDFNTSKYEKE